MSIYSLRDRSGKLTGKYAVEVQLNGKRLRSTATSFEEAQTMEEDLKYRLVRSEGSERPFDKRNEPKTLGDLYKKAEDTLWRGTRTAEQSLARCKASVEIVGTQKALSLLDTQDIDYLIEELLETCSPATVNRYLSAFHKLLQFGRSRKYLKEVPEFTWQRESEGRIRWVTPGEEEQLEKHLNALGYPQVWKVVKVAIETGMRRDEILKLDRTHVEPQWVRIWDPKNDKPRSVPISEATYGLLQSLLSSMPTRNVLRYAWDAAKERMGLKDDRLFVFHTTRHTCATRLLQSGVELGVIRDWMGHKDIATTLRYAHVHADMLLQALSKRATTSLKDVVTVGEPLMSPAREINGEQIPTATTGETAKSLKSDIAGVVKLADTQDLGSSIPPQVLPFVEP